ncbi:MAG: histidine kinase [Conexibacter sp.]|nr:histidine kinase [Conexibacter sp.]
MRSRLVSAARRPPLAASRDVGAALVVALVLVGVSTRIAPHGGGRAIDGLGYGLVVIAGTALAALRRFPRAVFGVTVAAVGLYVARHMPLGPILLTPLIALLGVSLCSDRRSSAIAAGVLCAVLAIAGLVAGSGVLLAVFFLGWCGAAVLIGDVVRRRDEQIAGLHERSRVLERTREEETRRRIAEDRLSIARDLHDSVAHAMTIINVQAGAAAHVVDQRPEAAKDALLSIRRTSRDVLEELSAMLSVLREPTAPAARAPAPGLAQVPGLIREIHEDGLSVSVASHGPLDRVPTSIGTAAYRIVQESVTNILRHTAAQEAEIRIVAGEGGELSVTVIDDGRSARGSANGSGAGRPGVGLHGMRERAEASGGRLIAGRLAQGGFRAQATWGSER